LINKNINHPKGYKKDKMLYYYFCAIFTLISAVVSFGFSIEAYLQSRSVKNLALSNAKYAMSRSFSLFLVSIGLLVYISTPYLIALSLIMIFIQLFDGIIGIKISVFKTVGPILTAVGNAIVLWLLLINQ
jgi:hypothetical protein